MAAAAKAAHQRIGNAKYDPGHPGHGTGTAAHGAGLLCGVKGAAAETPVAEQFCRAAQCQHFPVGRWITVLPHTVVLTNQNFSIQHQHSSHRNLILFPCQQRFIVGKAHKSVIAAHHSGGKGRKWTGKDHGRQHSASGQMLSTAAAARWNKNTLMVRAPSAPTACQRHRHRTARRRKWPDGDGHTARRRFRYYWGNLVRCKMMPRAWKAAFFSAIFLLVPEPMPNSSSSQ